MNRHLITRALPMVVAAAALLVHGAAAYVGQNPYAVHLAGPAGAVACTSEVLIAATVRFAETGALVSGQAVVWDLKVSLSPGDRLSARSTITGADGQTSVTLHFGSAEGSRTVRATIATWPATIVVTCGGATAPPTTVPTNPPTATPDTGPTPTPTPQATAPTPTLPTAPPQSALPALTPAPIPTASEPAATTGPSDLPSGQNSGADLTPVLLIGLLALGAGGVLLLVRARR